jgi:hypothetical protein
MTGGLTRAPISGRSLAPIRTHRIAVFVAKGTPSALEFHQVGQRPEGRRFAGSHRRSGLTPIPREGWHSFGCVLFLTRSVRTGWSRWQRPEPKRPIRA